VAPKEPQTSHSSNSSAAPPGLPRAAALRDGANIRYACFVAADLALPAMTRTLDLLRASPYRDASTTDPWLALPERRVRVVR
jgi:hypothetical protein